MVDLPRLPLGPKQQRRRRDFVVGGDRPVNVHVPRHLKPDTPAPLLLMLHARETGVDGEVEENYLQLGPVADANSMLYAYPDATFDPSGQRVWNATDASRGTHGPTVDDSAYLAAVVAEIKSRAWVDPRRIYFLGHSNGAFMCYRMACEHADIVAAIVSFAGATFWKARDCKPAEPVAVLQVHGTADNSVFYGGGTVKDRKYPGARRTVAMWARYNGCDSDARRERRHLNLVADHHERSISVDTKIDRYAEGCKPGGHAELWTIHGAEHIPALTDGFRKAVVAFLLAHPKP